MDPFADISPEQERLWIDEVRRLHALWHSGPPHSSSASGPLAATNTTAFKREVRRKRKAKKEQQLLDQATCPSTAGVSHLGASPSPTVSEWPCPPVTDRPRDEVREWGEKGTGGEKEQLSPVGTSSKQRLEEEKAKMVALQMQKEGIDASRAFLSKKCSSDEEDDLVVEEEEEGDDDDNREESVYLKFFTEVFAKNGDLRGYYEKNWEKGEFRCLICNGIGENTGKRFKDCVSLVQHSNSISKTKRKVAHREFARVVCRVLGWNVERLPSIVLDVGGQLGQTSEDGLTDNVLNRKEEPAVDVPDADG